MWNLVFPEVVFRCPALNWLIEDQHLLHKPPGGGLNLRLCRLHCRLETQQWSAWKHTLLAFESWGCHYQLFSILQQLVFAVLRSCQVWLCTRRGQVLDSRLRTWSISLASAISRMVAFLSRDMSNFFMRSTALAVLVTALSMTCAVRWVEGGG